MTAPAPTFQTMPGREVLATAICDFDARAEYGRSVVAAYGAAAIHEGMYRCIELDNATATVLRMLAARASARIEDLPRDKEGKPKFVDKLRFDVTQEIVRLFADAFRAAYVKVPVERQPEEADAA